MYVNVIVEITNRSIAGHEIILCEIGTEQGSLAEENIPIAWNQVATFDVDGITVTVRGQ